MDYDNAKEIRDYALKSIENLSLALNAAQDNCSTDELAHIKKGVGMSIVKIDNDVLQFLYTHYPELDHIKNS